MTRIIRNTIAAALVGATVAALAPAAHAFTQGPRVTKQVNGNQVSVHAVPLTPQQRYIMEQGMRMAAQANGASSDTAIVQKGSGNAAGIAQSGRGNKGLVYQQGSGHTGTLQQAGNGNSYGLLQYGHGTTGHVGQTGNGQAGLTMQYGWK